MKDYIYACVIALLGAVLALGGCGGSEPTPAGSPANLQATVAVLQATVASIGTPTAAAVDITATAAARATQTAPRCQVVTAGLRLRSGPAIVFDPPIAILTQGTALIPQNSSPDGQWVFVQVSNSEQVGWVDVSPQFITCNLDVASLPVGQVPPTPTPSSTPAPTTAAATATPIALVVIPRIGGGSGDLDGDVFTDPRIFRGSVNNPIFSDRMALQIQTWAKDGPQRDGAGIAYVDIAFIDDAGNGDAVYQKRENSPAYCSFGGDSPCPVLKLQPNGTWPDTHNQIYNGDYVAEFIVTPKDQNKDGGNWRVPFRIQIPGGRSGKPDVVAQIVQTGDGNANTRVSDALVFQVQAYDPRVGNSDGDGIDYVELRIIRSNNVVYQSRENNAAYCAFGGGDPNCNVWNFAEHDYYWQPNSNRRIQNGAYRLQATVYAKDGRKITVEKAIQIQGVP